jgi:hypothetical protein
MLNFYHNLAKVYSQKLIVIVSNGLNIFLATEKKTRKNSVTPWQKVFVQLLSHEYNSKDLFTKRRTGARRKCSRYAFPALNIQATSRRFIPSTLSV